MRASRNVSNRIISVVCPPEPSTTRVLTGLVRFFRLEDCCCRGQFDSSSQRIDFTTYATRSAKAVSPETVAAAAGLSRHSDEAGIVVIYFGWCFTIHHAYSVKSAQYELCNRDGNQLARPAWRLHSWRALASLINSSSTSQRQNSRTTHRRTARHRERPRRHASDAIAKLQSAEAQYASSSAAARAAGSAQCGEGKREGQSREQSK